jgi:hypothetical protein
MGHGERDSGQPSNRTGGDVKRRTGFAICCLGIEAWVGLHDTTSVPSLVIGCVCLAILITILTRHFTFRVRQEIQAIKEDNRQARDRRASRKRERQVGDEPTGP